jgi:[glutamine synthetase] adenylyltransferase / [glutamine synthetase]-adenylyl-L-tyrosine phosphorylase
LVILALGRLGGGALTYASDLDLIFLFSGDHGAESDGRRPLGATQYYNKLSQRIVAALSVATAAGPLYEVDTRLRPNGTQGLLAVSIDSFARYQAENAWSWEHMALCRARPVFGPTDARAELAKVIADTLAKPRDAAMLAIEVAQMRRDIAAHKPPKGALDAKLLPGGLVDVEFLTHYLQLSTGEGLVPGVEKAIAAHVAAGRLDAGFAAAHAFMTRMLVVVRLVSPDCDEPPLATQALVAARLQCPDWAGLQAQFNAHRALVIGQWERHLGSRDFAHLPQKDTP